MNREVLDKLTTNHYKVLKALYDRRAATVLLGRKGTIGIPQYIEGKYWNVDTAFDVQPFGNTATPRMIYYWAVCFDFGYYMSQTALPSMTQSDYGNMKVPLMDADEQIEIVKHLDLRCNEVAAIVKEKQAQVNLLRIYKNSLIYEYVTGKKEVSNQ